MEIDPTGSFAGLTTDDEELALDVAAPMKHLDTSQIPMSFLRESLPGWLAQARLDYANVQRGVYRTPTALSESSHSVTKRLSALDGMLVEIGIFDVAQQGIDEFEALLEREAQDSN